jgi:hypothetical protein
MNTVIAPPTVAVDVACTYAEPTGQSRDVGVELDAHRVIGTAVGIALRDRAVSADLREVALAIAVDIALGARRAAVANSPGTTGSEEAGQDGERCEF